MTQSHKILKDIGEVQAVQRLPLKNILYLLSHSTICKEFCTEYTDIMIAAADYK